jgi:hypothetical protein
MTANEDASSAEAIARKLRAISAVLADPVATEHERANARALKLRLEQQLKAQLPPPKQESSEIMFRLGRAIRELRQSTATPNPKGDWTDHAFRLGRMLRNGLRK